MQTRLRITAVLRSYTLRLCLALGVTAWLVVPARALTAAEIITEARVLLNDNSSDTGRQRFSDAQLLRFINDGQREANIFSWVLKSSYSLTLTAGTTEYPVPSDFLTTWRVTYEGRKIDQTSLNELDSNSPGFATASGRPQKYYLYLATTTWIGFTPAPNSTSTGTVVMYYVQQPTEITSTSSSPWNSWTLLTPYHSGLVYYTVYRGYQAMMEAEMAASYFTEWTLFVQSLKLAGIQQPDFNPGISGRR